MFVVRPITFEVAPHDGNGPTYIVSAPTDEKPGSCTCEDFTDCCEHTHAVGDTAAESVFRAASFLTAYITSDVDMATLIREFVEE